MAMTDALPPVRPSRTQQKPSLLRRLMADYGQEIIVAAAIVVLFVVVTAVNPRFISANNLTSIFSGNAYIAVAAIGMAMVIITGNIDVSVGALIGVLATISGTLAVAGYPIWVAWFFPVLVGMAVNALIGVLVAYARIPSIVVTLGALSIMRGGLITVTGGNWITGLPPDYLIAQQRLFGLPVPIIAMVVLTILAALWMRYSAFGRSLYALGGNHEAAIATGIPAERRIVAVFMINGLFAGVGDDPVRHAASGHPVDRPAQSGTDHHHRGGHRRRVDPRRLGHGHRLDSRGDPLRHHRLGADLHQRLGLLAARRHRPVDPGDRAGRHAAPAQEGMRR